MKILILTPDWNLPWIKILPSALREYGHDVSVRRQPPERMRYDVAVHMWGVGTTPSRSYAKRNVMFFRSYDFYYNNLHSVAWDQLDHVVNINSYMFDVVSRHIKGKPIKHTLLYNYIDHSKFTYKKRKHGKKIGMACHLHHKKNLPLALQILMAMDDDYELHIAGEQQEPDISVYLDEAARKMQRRVYLYDHIPNDQMDMWWEDKNYCLSTSIREGNPNNVIEAMSKGIMPVVHGWPGAEDQFGRVFYTVGGAIDIMHGEYDSSVYHDIAVKKFGDENLQKTIQIITEGD